MSLERPVTCESTPPRRTNPRPANINNPPHRTERRTQRAALLRNARRDVYRALVGNSVTCWSVARKAFK